ncbi:response regulator transcription factor [Marinobacterium litorale]|uniref:response regulator transcription factor n=1 Tax=Marinobacterium litorale TaxID=404770 RepID=UPI000565AB56|nr:response regulator [Marinobacterium litorale]
MQKGETVYVVDDDVSMREALNGLLRSHGFHVLMFDSAQALLDVFAPEGPSCLVLDVSMPEMTGLELQENLIALGETVPIVFITAYGDIPMTVRAIKSGAIEFLQKPVNDDELVASVEQGLKQDTINRAKREKRDSVKVKLETLTPREREVMEEAIKGRLNKQIAADLGVTEVTIKVHRHNMMQKMGVRSVAELVRMVSQYEESQ